MGILCHRAKRGTFELKRIVKYFIPWYCPLNQVWRNMRYKVPSLSDILHEIIYSNSTQLWYHCRITFLLLLSAIKVDHEMLWSYFWNSVSKWLRNTYSNMSVNLVCVVIVSIVVQDSEAWSSWHGDRITRNTSILNCAI